MITTKETIVACLSQKLAYLKDNYHVKRIGIFGSFAVDRATDSSDIDLVVEFDQPIGLKFVDLCEYLKDCLGRDVDVLTMAGIENIRNPSIAESIRESLIYV